MALRLRAGRRGLALITALVTAATGAVLASDAVGLAGVGRAGVRATAGAGVRATAGVESAAGTGPTAEGVRVPASDPGTPLTAAGVDQYAVAIDAAYARGMTVWIETDLRQRWVEGPAALAEAVNRVATLSRRPGVAGFKIVDEMGYRDALSSATRIRQFLAACATALRAAAPGKLILIDLLVPQLGCFPGVPNPTVNMTYCMNSQATKYPHLTLAAVDTYLSSGTVDVVDLSTHQRDVAGYAKWGVTPEQAQTAAWTEVNRRKWNTMVRLRGRKALAHPGVYTGTMESANRDLVNVVDIPTAYGAQAVDIWAWRQIHLDQVYRLMDPGNVSNALWRNLAQRRAAGVHMSTHFSPYSVEQSMTADLDLIATVFTDLLVAAGTG